MPESLDRRAYARMYGPTVGDRVRLADTALILEVEEDRTIPGEEIKFGGGKVIRDGMGQASAGEELDLVITTSSARASSTPGVWPMPSRITLPPPNLHSSPYEAKSFSTSMTRPVSPRVTRSPVVGPNIATYAARSMRLMTFRSPRA